MGPARFHCATLLSVLPTAILRLYQPIRMVAAQMYSNQKVLSEVGFEPTPTEVDCDLNAAP
jgi:hypothetical protein